MNFLTTSLLLLTLLFFSTLAHASDACTDNPYQQFDFWLGSWDVHTKDGEQAGTNLIEKGYDGCVITEQYRDMEGPYGSSINMYDRTTGKWYQSWGDKTGLRLALEGQIKDGRMVLSGSALNEDGQTVLHQIAWTPNNDGSVTQLWQSKAPDSAGWQTLFEGTYTRN